mgnify:CR=1 FL=1
MQNSGMLVRGLQGAELAVSQALSDVLNIGDFHIKLLHCVDHCRSRRSCALPILCRVPCIYQPYR